MRRVGWVAAAIAAIVSGWAGAGIARADELVPLPRPTPDEVAATVARVDRAAVPPKELKVAWRAADEPPPGPRTMEPVDVYGNRPAPSPVPAPMPTQEPWFGPTESAPFGPYGAPEWVSQRRWATTRAYVLPTWQVEFESWWKGKFPKHGGDQEHLFQEEIAVGLPHRFQLDLYGNFEKNEGEDAIYSGTQLELRYALADWDCLWGNPTLYGEWKFNTHGASDAWEVKFLLADDLGCSPCWHWGVNLFYEREIEDEETEEMGATAALSRSVIDQRLSLGVEAQYERTTVKGSRNDPEQEFLLGPSVQVRFNADTHLDIVPLFGLTEDSPAVEIFVVFGIALGGGSGSGAWGGPASARSR